MLDEQCSVNEMPRPRQVEVNERTRAEIKRIARGLMAENGTNGLSIRAIARQIGLAPSSLYYYYNSLDDLITALIYDAFTSYAAYIRQARDTVANTGATRVQQLWAAVLAYREWAILHPIDFQLIYGNPIPGYEAPADLTTPAAKSIGDVFLETLLAAYHTNELTLPQSESTIPPTVQTHYQQAFGMDEEVGRIYQWMNMFWGVMHGYTTLEVYHHLQPVVGDCEAFYHQAMRTLLQTHGFDFGWLSAQD